MTEQGLIMLIVAILGCAASVGTCGYVIFIFKRMHAERDRLANALENLSITLNNFRLEVTGQYMHVMGCRQNREDCGAWKKKVEDGAKAFECRIEDRLLEGVKQITRLETIVSIINKDKKYSFTEK